MFHDPRNWALDVQIASDILRFGGYVLPPHARSSVGDEATEGKHHVELVFCNPDLLWGSDFPSPRIGQGGFRLAFQALFKVCAQFVASELRA